MPSTAIRWCSYDAGTQELTITFVSGRKYLYFGVPPEKFSTFVHTPSRGAFFNREIRDTYGYREVIAAHGDAE